MTQLDFFVLAVAGVVGAIRHPWTSPLAWAIVAVWAIAKCLHILT